MVGSDDGIAPCGQGGGRYIGLMRWLSLLVLFAACSSEAAAAAADRFTLECESWFRASEAVPPGKGQKLALPVNVSRGLVLEIGGPPKATKARGKGGAE